MTLAAILAVAVCLLNLGWALPGVRGIAVDPAAQQTQSQPAQGSQPTQTSPASPAQNTAPPAKPRRRKKTIVPDCTIAPTALNPAAGNSGNSAKPPDAASANSASTNPGSASSASGNSNLTKSGTARAKPCPPPKKVVRNGGSEEPAVQLTGGTTAQQASIERATTEQLTAASEENLKKIAGRQLNPSQQEQVNQIQQFMEQSKKAVAAGDLERAHNLALKAHLLSDELVKP